jgi:coenzyme F420 hydrogenase subunit beta
MHGVEHVVAAGLCVGCGGCVSAEGGLPASTLRFSPGGHLRPVFDRPADAAASRRAAAVCPAIELQLEPDPAAPVHALWGPLVSVHTGWALDATVRHQGSSGGVLSALLVHLLESGQVDFIAQVGADPEAPLHSVRRLSRTREDVLAAAGSRYAPSPALRDVEALFASGERFAFVGKPCDVAAMRRVVAQRPEWRAQLKFVLSFLCAGVPAQQGTTEVLQALGTEASEVRAFRYRGEGWPGQATALTHDGRRLQMDYNRSWGEILGRHLPLRCKLCPDGTGEFADLVCGDAWYGEDGYPDFDEREGRSLVLSRTALGEQLLQQARAAGAVTTAPEPVDAIDAMQPYQRTRKQVVLGRWLAVGLRTGVWPRFRGLHLGAALRSGGWMPALRNAWGTFRRTRREARE